MKKLFKLFKKASSNFFVRFIFFVGITVAILAIGGAFNSKQDFGKYMKDLITSTDVISIFFIAAVSTIFASIVIKAKNMLEDSLKIEDDHHKIICKYNGHISDKDIDFNSDYFDETGVTMDLHNVHKTKLHIRNPEKDKLSGAYKQRSKDIALYRNNRLLLPNVNVFTNVSGNVKVRFEDSPELFPLPDFVSGNSLALMEAHVTSNTSNNKTIRLNNMRFKNGELVLDTQRTRYFDMLVTNRCMDYKLSDNVTLREVYESNSKITPLAESQLSNQIGINGLIFTKDGYLLIEKRGRKKIIWKNKFAQPISLAMKLSDVKFDDTSESTFTIEGSVQTAEKTFKRIILNTLKKNFGITEEDLCGFSVSENLFGIARDLLEGGKPNIYFYVMVNYTATEFAKLLQDKCRDFALNVKAERKHTAAKSNNELSTVSKFSEATKSDKNNLPSLSKDKLDSDFYLIKHEDMSINYRYAMKVKAKDIYRIKRQYYPCVNALTHAFDGNVHKLRKLFGLSIKKECGDALLACLYYANVCKQRIGFQGE